MFRIAVLGAVCLLAPATVAAQEQPSAATAHPRARLLPRQGSIDARIADMTSRHLRRCWQSNADLGPNSGVTIAFTLTEAGSLTRAPRVLYPRGWLTRDQREAVRRALAAVHACEPFPMANDPEFAAHYSLWREHEVTFDLSRQR